MHFVRISDLFQEKLFNRLQAMRFEYLLDQIYFIDSPLADKYLNSYLALS